MHGEHCRSGAGTYGLEPISLPNAVARRDQLSAASAYRDYAGYTGRDATGPAPNDGDSIARSLWRAAQRSPEVSDAYRRP